MHQKNLTGKAGLFLERYSGWIIVLLIVCTGLLIIPLVESVPREQASSDPGGQVFDLLMDIDSRFPNPAHNVAFILENPDGDMLTQEPLWELYQNSERLRRGDLEGELTPPGLAQQAYLLPFLRLNPSPGLEAPLIGYGIYSIADAVHEALIKNPGFPTGLQHASNSEIKEAFHHLLSDPANKNLKNSLSSKATHESRQVLNREIDYWRSPAIVAVVVADNGKLGGGSAKINMSMDDITRDKEQFNRRVQAVLRGEEKNYHLWGVAIDLGLEIEDESKIAGPFIMATVIAVLIMVGLVIRSYWAVALTGVGIGFLIIWLKGISNLLGLKSGQVIDFIVPIAIISLGVDFAIHTLCRYREERNKGHGPRVSLGLGLGGILGALVLAMMTDGLAFLSNIASGIESVVGFGIGAGVAVVASFALLGIGVPLAMMRIDTLGVGDMLLRNEVRPSPLLSMPKVIAITFAAGISGAAVILLVAVSSELGILTILGFIVFGLVLPLLILTRQRVAFQKATQSQSSSKNNRSLFDSANLTDSLPEPTSGFSFQAILVAMVVRLANRRAIVLPVVAIVTVLAVFFALRLEATLDVKDFFDSGSDFVVGLDKLDHHLGDSGGETGLIYIRGNLADPESLKAMQAMLANMSQNPYLAKDADGQLILEPTVFTLLGAILSNRYVREQIEELNGVKIMDVTEDGIPDSAIQIGAAYDYMVNRGISLEDGTQIYDSTRVREILFHEVDTMSKEDVTVIRVQIPGTRQQGTVLQAKAALEEDMKILKTAPSIFFSGLTGSPFTRQASLSAATRALHVSLPIAVGLCFLLMLVAMRSFKFAAVTIIPIGLVVAWLYAVMYLGGFALNFITALIAAVSIGIGVDYSVHITQRFRQELIVMGNRDCALRRATDSTGMALLGSAASSIVGFAIMGFAPMPMFASYGRLTAIMITLAVVAALLVLPSLLLLVTGTETTET